MTARTLVLNVVAPSTTMPSWYPAVGGCVQIPGTGTIGTSVRAAGGNSYPGTDPDDICKPWSGGAIVTVGGLPYLVVYGGGHGDSYYNGIHKFGPLYGTGSDAPSWSVFLAASPVGVQNNNPTYTDGRQCSLHTYNLLTGVADKLYCISTDDNDSSHSGDCFAFTPAGQSNLAANASLGYYGAAAHYNGKIYYIGGSSAWDRLRIYDIATDTWTVEPSAIIALGNYVRMAVDTARGAILVTSGATSPPQPIGEGLYWPNVNTIGTRRTNITAPPASSQSLEYDADRDVFVSYVSNSLTLYEASAATLAAGGDAVWVARTFTGPVPPASPAAGTYGRFRYVPQLKGYIVVPNLETSAYFFRAT